MSRKNKTQKFRSSYELISLNSALGILRSIHLFIVLLSLFAFRAPAQSTPKFYKWNELDDKANHNYRDFFEGYGMQIQINYGMQVESYQQNLNKGLLGEVVLQASDEAIQSGSNLYVVVIQRWSYNNMCNSRETVLADVIEVLAEEFKLQQTGYLNTKSLYPYYFMYDYQPNFFTLDFKCKELTGKSGDLYNSGEVCVACTNEDMFIVYVLNKDKSTGYSLYALPLALSKSDGY